MKKILCSIFFLGSLYAICRGSGIYNPGSGGGGGGGNSTLAVGTGTAANFTNNVSSPTNAISFLGTQFNSLAVGTTNFVSLSTYTLINQNTLQSGSTAYPQYFYVGSTGSVLGAFSVGGVLKTGSSAISITNGTGNLDLSQGVNNVPQTSLGNGQVNTNGSMFGGGALSSTLTLGVLSSSGTLQGNTFNGASQLVQTQPNGFVPNAVLSGVIFSTNTLQANTTAYPNFLYVGSTMSVLGTSLGVNGVSYVWPGSQASGTKILQNDGSGNLTWATGGSGTPGGAQQQFQYFGSGSVFSGSPDLTESNGGGGLQASSVTVSSLLSTGTITASGLSSLNGGVSVSSSVAIPNPANIFTSTFTIPSPSTMTVVLASATLNGTGFPITLPDATANAGKEIMFYKVSKDTGTITIQPGGSDLIEGTTYPVLLNALSQHAALYSLGASGWAEGMGGIQNTPDILTPTGGDQHNSITVGASSNVVVCSYYTPVPVYVNQYTFDVFIQGSGTTMSFYIMDRNGRILGSTTNVAVPAAGVHTQAQSPPVLIPAGPFNVGWQASQTTVSVGGFTEGNSGIAHCSKTSESSMVLGNVSLPGSTVTSAPFIGLIPAGARQTYQ